MQSSKSDIAGLESVIQQSTERDLHIGGTLRTTDLLRNILLTRLSGGRIIS